MADVAYQVTQLELPASFIKQHFRAVRTEEGLAVRGLCKRCEHDADQAIAEQTLVPFNRGEPITMLCNCEEEHEGRQSGKGCGAWWRLTLG